MNSIRNEVGRRLVRGRSLARNASVGQNGNHHGTPVLWNGVGTSRGLAVGSGVRELPEIPWEAQAEGLDRLHLLVVDADAGVRSACAEIAQRMGFEVVQAADVVSAQAVVRHQKVDLMLMDLQVPSPGARSRMAATRCSKRFEAAMPRFLSW